MIIETSYFGNYMDASEGDYGFILCLGASFRFADSCVGWLKLGINMVIDKEDASLFTM